MNNFLKVKTFLLMEKKKVAHKLLSIKAFFRNNKL